MVVSRIKPTKFDPMLAPAFVELKLDALKQWNNGTLNSTQPWYASRQLISPRIAIIHTNGAEGEGSIESAINWGNREPSNTKPHYQFDRYRAAKLLPTNRRGIANATVDSVQNGHGDVAEFSIAFETADAGWPTPGNDGGFIGDQVEMIAQCLAYESIVFPEIVLTTPKVWYGAGVCTHTDPFPYPYYTIVPGKACPGTRKKYEFVHDIMPLARVIRAEWTHEEREEDYMELLDIPARAYSTRPSDKAPGGKDGPLKANERRVIKLPLFDGTKKAVQLNIKVIPLDGNDKGTATDAGWLRVVNASVDPWKAVHSNINWGVGQEIAFSPVDVNITNNEVALENGPAGCEIIIDLMGSDPV